MQDKSGLRKFLGREVNVIGTPIVGKVYGYHDAEDKIMISGFGWCDADRCMTLRSPSVKIHSIRDLKEPTYDDLVGMFKEQQKTISYLLDCLEMRGSIFHQIKVHAWTTYLKSKDTLKRIIKK